uniref:Cysteine-rich repeat secretory protein 15 n=1 Tax=Anthurium amnicola TaxID=1678845 RepID=A0A1D1YX30_9ARAE
MALPGTTTVGLLVMLLLGDHIMLGVCGQDAECSCSTESYDADGAYGRHVFYVKYDLWVTTPKHQNENYDYYNSSPADSEQQAYGHAKCSTDLGPDDCRGCIGAALGVMNDRCGLSVGASVVLDRCQLRYEASPIRG